MGKTRYSEESEKALERYLGERLRLSGGISLKYHNATSTGWPDRICLLPGGHVFWVELKSKGKNPTPLQAHRQSQLRDLKFHVYTCDSRDKIDRALRLEARRTHNLNDDEQTDI